MNLSGLLTILRIKLDVHILLVELRIARAIYDAEAAHLARRHGSVPTQPSFLHGFDE